MGVGVYKCFFEAQEKVLIRREADQCMEEKKEKEKEKEKSKSWKESKSPYFGAWDLFEGELDAFKTSTNMVFNLFEQLLKKTIIEIKERSKYKDLDQETLKRFKNFTDYLNKLLKGEISERDVDLRDLHLEGILDSEAFLGIGNISIFSWKYLPFIRNMSLIYLICEFETFLRYILRITFEKNPEILRGCQKSIKYKEISKIKNTNEIKQLFIQKEITDLCNKDIEDINRYFKENFNINLANFANWKEFKERFYRRNIIVHNSGLINKIYRLKTGYEGEKIVMDVNREYLEKSIELFKRMFLMICKSFDSKFK